MADSGAPGRLVGGQVLILRRRLGGPSLSACGGGSRTTVPLRDTSRAMILYQESMGITAAPFCNSQITSLQPKFGLQPAGAGNRTRKFVLLGVARTCPSLNSMTLISFALMVERCFARRILCPPTVGTGAWPFPSLFNPFGAVHQSKPEPPANCR